MARPIYPHELADPDFQWLISTYKENNSVSFTIEATCLPVILITGPGPKPVSEEVNLDEPKQVPCVGEATPHLKDESEYS